MNKNNILHKLLVISFLLATVFGCTTSNDSGGGGVQVIYHPAENKPHIVVYSKYVPVNIAEKKSYKINTSIMPDEEASSTLVYTSSDTSVATVTDDGNVTINKTGIAIINIALEKDSSINTQVIINAYNGSSLAKSDVPVRAIAVDTTYIKLKKGNGLAIFPSVRPGNASNKEIGYLSTNKSIASIENGLIQANSDGSAGIIVYAKSNPEIYAFINVDVSSVGNSGNVNFNAPAGIDKIDLNADPFSLIAKYQILTYSINGDDAEVADDVSNLRVNVNLDELGAGFVKILMFVNLNGKEVRLVQKKNIDDYGSIPDIFTSLGAKITGDYTMEFTLAPATYTELARQGLVNKGDTLILNIGKLESLTPAGDLGSDIVFDLSNVPVEGENTDDVDDNSSQNNNAGSNNQTTIPVESIEFDITEFSPVSVNETIQINAVVYPDEASNKILTWKSSNNAVATVDKNGLVTIYKNGSAIITAQSSNGKKAEMKIIPAELIDWTLNSDKIELTLDVDAEANLTYKVYPDILSNEVHNAEYYTDNEDIIIVDNNGNIKAISAGETFVRVTLNDKPLECFVIVHPKPENAEPVTEIVLTNGSVKKINMTEIGAGSKFSIANYIEVLPANAYNKRLKYQSSDEKVATVNSTGEITINGIGIAEITIISSSNQDIKAIYTVIVETLPTNIVYERFDYGVEIGTTAKIIPIYEGNPSNTNTIYKILDNISVASVNETTGEVTGLSSGTATLQATTENGKIAKTIITVYRPVVVGDVSSLQGTYQIVDFNQANGHLDVGTNAYGGVERMIGEMTIEVNGNNVKIKSKIQMDSSAMNNFGGVLGQGKEQARQGQFQYTEYTEATYNANGFGTAGQTSAKVTHDNDMFKLYQEWKEMGIATVKVNTWIKKKADTIKDLEKEYFHWSKNGAKYDTPANAIAHHPNIKAPKIEPYYIYGLITK